jgi:hypothetical protein
MMRTNRHRARFAILALVLSYGCGPRPDRVEDREYHSAPELVADPRISADEGLIARDGPLLVLHLREPGKPDFALDIFVRKYGLETVDPKASYVFNVHIEYFDQRHVTSKTIERITKNGTQIYP